MSTELIINASLPETRLALLENGEIQELHIERDSERGIVGNIYKGKVIRVLPGMQAAFVDIGLERAAFLYVDDIFYPDMKTPLETYALPDEETVARALEAAKERAEARGRLGAPSGRDRFERGGRGRHSGGGRGRDAGRGPGKIARPVLPVITGGAPKPVFTGAPKPGFSPASKPGFPADSPEAHAALQREYAKSMLDIDEEQYLAELQAKANAAVKNSDATPTEAVSSEDQGQPAPVQVSVKPLIKPLIQPLARPIEPQAPAQATEPLAEQAAEQTAEQIAEQTAEQTTEQPVAAQTESQPMAPEAQPTAVYSEAAPSEENEVTARSPSAEDLASGEDESGDSAAAYRPEPQMDAEAWAEELEPIADNGPVASPVGAPEVERKDDEDDEVREAPRRRRRPENLNIADLIKEGQEILVQVAKEPIGTKGARLTCHVSLPGRYLVFMPSVDHIGVSRRIENDTERRRLKELISHMRPAKTGVIVRTASGKQDDKKLKADLDYLVETWNDIQARYNKQRPPSVVYQDLNFVLRAIRDIFTDDVDKVVVDSKREFKSITKFVTRLMSNLKDRVELYEGKMPIFDTYGIEPELERALERKVWLKSGGYLVIDQAEALVAIDVNTGRYVGKTTLEETILKTNLEAVKEIAYQLRLRNFGGIIILDLIDMEKEANREKVYKVLEEALKGDRARPAILKISQLGLIEMTRKRTRESLVRSLCEQCVYCQGRGFVKNNTTLAFDILREIEREGVDPDTTEITIQCHPAVADVLSEDKRDVIENLEHLYSKKISIRANGAYHAEQYELVAHRSDGKNISYSAEERKQKMRAKIQETMKVSNAARREAQRNEQKADRAIEGGDPAAGGDQAARRERGRGRRGRGRDSRGRGGRDRGPRPALPGAPGQVGAQLPDGQAGDPAILGAPAMDPGMQQQGQVQGPVGEGSENPVEGGPVLGTVVQGAGPQPGFAPQGPGRGPLGPNEPGRGRRRRRGRGGRGPGGPRGPGAPGEGQGGQPRQHHQGGRGPGGGGRGPGGGGRGPQGGRGPNPRHGRGGPNHGGPRNFGGGGRQPGEGAELLPTAAERERLERVIFEQEERDRHEREASERKTTSDSGDKHDRGGQEG